MSSNDALTPGQIICGLLILGTAMYAGHYVYKKHFKGRSPEEIRDMVDDAFKKLGAIIGVIHDASHIAQDTLQTLQSGYVSLDINNITSEKVQRVSSLLHNLGTLLENKPEAKEPIEIIGESVQLIAESRGINQLI